MEEEYKWRAFRSDGLFGDVDVVSFEAFESCGTGVFVFRARSVFLGIYSKSRKNDRAGIANRFFMYSCACFAMWQQEHTRQYNVEHIDLSELGYFVGSEVHAIAGFAAEGF